MNKIQFIRFASAILFLPLFLNCSGFHDRSSISTIYDSLEKPERQGTITGELSHYLNRYDAYVLNNIPGQEVILIKKGEVIETTVTNIDGQFSFQAPLPQDNYVLRFPVRCWETSWHIRYARRNVDFPVTVKTGIDTHVKVIIDCPQEPLTLD
jgi:hypothetical protein